MKKIGLIISLAVFAGHLNAQTTWSEDAAEVFYNNCTSCHHPDGIGTFSLLDYPSAYAYKSAISANVSAGIMPPWTADSSFQHYYDERILSEADRNTILDWVAEGALEGDPDLAPPPPVYSGGQILPGTPDLTVQMPTYMSKATSSSDDYVCISIPTVLLEDKKLRAMEVVPGNQAIVHHCLVFHDEDGSYPTDTIGGDCSGPDDGDLIGGYAPGTQPTIFPAGSEWQSGMEMKAGSHLVFALHYPHGSYGEYDSTKVNLYFYDEPVADFREVYAYPLLANMSFNIEAETIDTVEDDMTMFADWTFISALPHMHLLGQSIETYGLSGGDTVPMVRIPQWDFEWQDIYYFEYLQPLYEDDLLYGKGVYDNTSSNPNNPNDPPIDVGWGFDTQDEMFLVYFSFMIYQDGDEYISTDSLNTLFMSNEYEKVDIGGPELNVFPNPFMDNVTVSYQLQKNSNVRLYIYDTHGRVVKKLLREEQTKGTHKVIWDGTNEKGTEISKGLYFFSMMVDDQHYSGRIVKR